MVTTEQTLTKFIEQAAEKHANIIKPIQHNNIMSVIRYKGYVVGAQSMVPIILDLVEALEEAIYEAGFANPNLEDAKWVLKNLNEKIGASDASNNE